MESLFLSPVTFLIIIVTAITSIYCFSKIDFYAKSVLEPYWVYQGKKLHTLLTSGFIHADYSHLFFNMLSFYFFAPMVEMFFLGMMPVLYARVVFLMVYLLALIISDLPTVYMQRNNPGYASLGASGAVCAIIYMAILIEPNMSIYMGFIPYPIPAPLYGLLYIGLSIYLSKRGGDNINHYAHLSGAVFGIVAMLIIAPELGIQFLDYLKNIF